MTRVVLVGESNPYSLEPRHALLPWPAASAGARLRRILDMGELEYLRTFARFNLLGPGEAWSAQLVRARAGSIFGGYVSSEACRVVLLGARVTAAFGWPLNPFHVAAVCEREADAFEEGFVVRALRLPHPSGRCRAWNEPGAAARARAAVAELMADPPAPGLMVGFTRT